MTTVQQKISRPDSQHFRKTQNDEEQYSSSICLPGFDLPEARYEDTSEKAISLAKIYTRTFMVEP